MMRFFRLPLVKRKLIIKLFLMTNMRASGANPHGEVVQIHKRAYKRPGHLNAIALTNK